MKKSLFRLFAVILAIFTLAGSLLVVSAAPVDSYTYWTGVGTQRKPVYNKAMYDVDTLIDVAKLGTQRFTKISAMCKDDNDNIYILDSTSRIVVLDEEYNFVKEIGKVDGSISYDNARGLYYNENALYICNTEGVTDANGKTYGNIYKIDLDGNLIDEITLPESEKANLIPEGFNFRPTRIARDSKGYMYVLSDGCYYGALLYSPTGEFLGFYGANTVKTTITSVFTNISNRLFPNAEKHANSIRKLPYPFVDLTIDSEGFIYTTNAFTDTTMAQRKGQIRRLSPGGGKNILDAEVNFADERLTWTIYKNKNLSQIDLCDIEVDSRGFIYVLESKYDKIFIHDADCRQVSIFGGGMSEGKLKGTFTEATAMVLLDDGDRIVVADSSTGFLTVFKINEYGKLFKKLDYETIEGNYDNKEGWLQVLAQDSNNQIAYSGLANAYLEEENYDEALKYAKLGYDKKTYAVAFEYVRKDFISDNFTWIFIVLVVVIIGAIAFMFITNKKKIVLIKNKSLNLMLTTMIHPSNNFTDIKEKKLGSMPLCFLLLFIYYAVTVLKTIAGGFLFSNYDPTSFNSILVLVRSVGLVVLWIVSNWLVCTLLEGKGKLKEITIITCYSLQPLILTGVIHILLSNVLLPVEGSFLGILGTIGTIYFGIMLVIGMLKVHDYSMGKFIWTSVLTVLGMAIIVFLIIMLIILVQQFGAFILTLITEISTL